MKKLTMAFLALLIFAGMSFASGEPMVLEFNTALSSGTMIEIPHMGAVDAVIDWGDGSKDTVTGEWEATTHTYASNGFYTVKISGSVQQFGNNEYIMENRKSLTAVKSWGDLGITDFGGAFAYCINLREVPPTLPSGVINMGDMFREATSFDGDLSGWDVSSVTNMHSMFYNASSFNGDISGWNVSNVRSMNGMFQEATSFDGDLSGWDVSSVTNMDSMFSETSLSTENYNALLTGWASLGKDSLQSNVNFHAGSCQYSSPQAVYARAYLIDSCGWTIGDGGFSPTGSGSSPMVLEFNTALSVGTTIEIPLGGIVNVEIDWGDGSKDTVTTAGTKVHTYATDGVHTVQISGLAEQFGSYSYVEENRKSLTAVKSWGDLGTRNLNGAFQYCANLTEVPPTVPAGVTNMNFMFAFVSAFNGDLSAWDVSNVTSMYGMFQEATSFDGDLSGWDVSKVTDMAGMFWGSTLSTPNYDALLTGWASLGKDSLQSNVNFYAGSSQYSSARAVYARAYLIDSCGWTIADRGYSPTDSGSSPMVLEFNTALSSGTTIEIPLGGTVNVLIDWGDGSKDAVTTAGTKVHTYSTNGIYTVEISGSVEQFGSDSYVMENRKSLTAVKSWGDLGTTSFKEAFEYCANLTEVPPTVPSSVTNMYGMFWGASSFNGDISAWDVSNVTNMSRMFLDAYLFNGDLSGWDVSSVTGMSYMFSGAERFKSDLSAWDVSNVTDMSGVFDEATAFNCDISAWDVSGVTNMGNMFRGAWKFNSDLSGWDVSSVTDMSFMFAGFTLFNGDLSGWDVSSVTNMSGMFSGATSFNGDLSGWDVSSVANMSYMFAGATSFNGDLSGWDVSNVTDMNYMFHDATSFNGDLSGWDVSRVINMSAMFSRAVSFNGDISAWDVSNVIYMQFMFSKVSLTPENYDALLTGWASLSKDSLQSNVNFHAGSSQYSSSQAIEARAYLSDSCGWTITDGGVVSSVAIEQVESDRIETNKLLFAPNPVPAGASEVFFTTPLVLRGKWEIAIYDNLGNLIDREQFHSAGGYTYHWDLRNRLGQRVGSGMYAAIISFEKGNGERQIFKKMIGVAR